MPNNRSTPLPVSFTPEETEALLASFHSLPLPQSSARRIRASVLQEAAPKRSGRRIARRILLPLAASIAALVLLFACFPKAAQAVAAFFGLSYTPSRYMNTLPESRTPLPSVEEALTAAAPLDGEYKVTLMPDLPNAQECIDYRAANGLKPFSEADWGWLREIRPEIAEVLYDGSTLIWNTNLYTTNDHVRSFMTGFGIDTGATQSVDALMGDVSYTVEGDSTVYPLYVSGHGITPIFDDSVQTADHVVLYSDFAIRPEQPLPDGVITITQNILVSEEDAMDSGKRVAVITHTFHFDTTAGNTQSIPPNEQIVSLSGKTYLTIAKYTNDTASEYDGTIETNQVSLDGVKLRVLSEYLPTGIHVTITPAEVPKEWSESMTTALLMRTDKTIQGTIESPGVLTELWIDGESEGDAQWPDNWNANELTYILPIFPDSYAQKQALTLKLTLVYDETVDGVDLLGGAVYNIPKDTWQRNATTATFPLAEISIPVP